LTKNFYCSTKIPLVKKNFYWLRIFYNGTVLYVKTVPNPFHILQRDRGEKMIMSLQAITLSVAFSEISNPNYADGIGYSTTTGVVDEERIVVECSSGGREENIPHTYGDS
jgi:hypothetical protein